jgi:hypothetical protein
MQKEIGPARRQRRTGPGNYLERDPAVVRDRLAPERDPLDRVDAVLRELEEPERDELDRERDEDALLERPFDELRELLDERRRLAERLPPFRSAAGTSSRATAFASCSICRARNFAIRSSSRRMSRAIFAVSLSPTDSANDSMPV